MRSLALVVLAFLLAAPATAAGAERLRIVSSEPGDGASTERTVEALPWQVTLDAASTPTLVLEVATAATLDPDGTLAAATTVQSSELTQSAGDPTGYTGTSGGPDGWGDTPGTYYWQLRTPDAAFVSDVYKLVVRPLYLERAEYKSAARQILTKKMGRKPRGLAFVRFSRSGPTEAVAWASWYDRRYVYAGYLAVEATSSKYFYRFTQGVRASRACIRRSGLKRCERRFRL